MKITKQQRAAKDKAVIHAALTAIRTHFTGPGAQARIIRFICDSLYSSCSWFAKLLCLGSWSIVGGLLIGPDHDLLLAQFHAWLIETPVDQVSSQLQTGFLLVAEAIVKLSCSDLHLKRGPASIQADSRPGITATDSPFKPALAANEPAFSRADRHFIRAN